MPSHGGVRGGGGVWEAMVHTDLARLQLHCLDWDPVNEAGKP